MATAIAKQDAQSGAAVEQVDEFSALLKQSFKSKTERAASEVDNAITTLVKTAMADTGVIQEDVMDTISEMIRRIDEKLSDQLNAVMHAPEFQALESAWRGLNYLANNSETDATLKLRVMNVSKNELYRDLKTYPGAKWDQSPLFKKLYEAECGQLGGEPYGCLVLRCCAILARLPRLHIARSYPVPRRRFLAGIPGRNWSIRETSARFSKHPTMPVGVHCAIRKIRATSPCACRASFPASRSARRP